MFPFQEVFTCIENHNHNWYHWTLRNLKKVRSSESEIMAEQQETNQNIPALAIERPHMQRTMEDLWRPVIRDEYSTMRQPAMNANNFELKTAFITMVQQHQYTGHPSEDPNEHMGRFLRMTNKVKLNGVRPEVIRLQLFPFSLRDMTTSWFDSLPYGSVNNWEVLVEAYMSRFFPLALTSERR